ncbi:hypothetical protein C8J57DRAFT_1352098 [Mycena rebaudengoi]|nr:hypothetical protein C8J57DRAFT_1352098 [Mycena rebaudengoi]
MAIRHSEVYSPLRALGGANDHPSTYHSSIYATSAAVGSNIPYRYHTRDATSVDALPEPYTYAAIRPYMGQLDEDGSTIRQQTMLPRLQIPTLDSPSSASFQRVNRPIIASATPSTSRVPLTPYSALATAYSPYRGPLSAPDASEDFRYHQLYDAHSAAQQDGGHMPSSRGVATEDAESQRRSLSPIRSARRTAPAAVIACRQCRSRKIRCDSTRPHCSNCARRADHCEYDPAPKRRGPDKQPGTRRRRSKKEVDEITGAQTAKTKRSKASSPTKMLSPTSAESMSPAATSAPAPANLHGEQDQRATKKRKRDSAQDLGELELTSVASVEHQHPPSSRSYGSPVRQIVPINSRSPPHQAALRVSTDDSVLLRHTHAASELSNARFVGPSYTYDATSFPRSSGSYQSPVGPPHRDHPKFPALPSRALQEAQQRWWSQFLQTYTSIGNILTTRFSDTSLSLSFLNVPFFLERLWSSTLYLTIQPAFVLAALALATLVKSSETGQGASGRRQAEWLRGQAEETLEQTWRDGLWLDASLAEAALVYPCPVRSSAHPHYHPDRVARAFGLLDKIVSALGLTSIDVHDRDVCRYARGAAPLVDVAEQQARFSSANHPNDETSCRCIPPDTPRPDADSIWSSVLRWDPSWSASEIRDEECRRLCWSALTLATSFRTECIALARTDGCAGLALCEPANYLILFPNEVYDRGVKGGTHPKNALWALYCRSMLVANFCANIASLRADTRDEKDERAELLQDCWNEVRDIADALDIHVCNLHTAVTYLCRENVSNTRIIITKMLRSLEGFDEDSSPSNALFNRKQADEWISYQTKVVERVTTCIHYLNDSRGHQLTRLAICLLLWEHDTSLTAVLVLAKLLLVPVEVMNTLWPCDCALLLFSSSKRTLMAPSSSPNTCATAGHEPPLAQPFALPM